jgi:hypothetical protein
MTKIFNQNATSIFRGEEETEHGKNSTGRGWVWGHTGIQIILFEPEFSLLTLLP